MPRAMHEQSHGWLRASIFKIANPATGKHFQCCGLRCPLCRVFRKKKKDQNLSDPDMQGGNIYNVDDQIPLVRHTSVFF